MSREVALFPCSDYELLDDAKHTIPFAKTFDHVWRRPGLQQVTDTLPQLSTSARTRAHTQSSLVHKQPVSSTKLVKPDPKTVSGWESQLAVIPFQP